MCAALLCIETIFRGGAPSSRGGQITTPTCVRYRFRLSRSGLDVADVAAAAEQESKSIDATRIAAERQRLHEEVRRTAAEKERVQAEIYDAEIALAQKQAEVHSLLFKFRHCCIVN